MNEAKLIVSLLAATLALSPLEAEAVVAVGNPGNPPSASLTMDGALRASILVDAVTYEPCAGPEEVDETTVDADLVDGMELHPSGSEYCRVRWTLHDDVYVVGVNENGPFEVVIAASDFDVTENVSILPYIVVVGSVSAAPVLDIG